MIGENINDRCAALLIESCRRTSIQCRDSQIWGGDGAADTSSRTGGSRLGGVGVCVLDCPGVSMVYLSSTVTGGDGGKAVTQHSPFIPYSGPSAGGDGIFIKRSSVMLREGSFIGGKGGDGGIFHSSTYESVSLNGARGGNGVTLKENAHASLLGVRFQGGPGGEPNGETGVTVQKDASSMISYFYLSAAANWALYGD